MGSIGGLGYLNQINKTNMSKLSSLQKIATGSAHPSASYGPSAYAISSRMYSNIGAVVQSNRNAQNTNALLATAAGGIDSTVSALSSLKENILKAANGTNAESDVAAIGKAVNQTIQTVDENASIEFNGKKLLTGKQTIATAGIDGYTNHTIGDMTAKGLGLVDENGKSTLDLSSQEGIEAALSTVDDALNKALDEAATVGAAQQNLSYASANYTVEEENLTGSVSTLDDADIAKEVTKFKNEDTLNQLALMAQKMYMHQSANVLSLLQ